MSDDDRRPQWPTDITKGAAAEWRRERDAKGGQAPESEAQQQADREAHARALWRDARTPELRAHLRLIYPHLSERERPARANIPYPDGFHSWPLDKRTAWRAEANKLTAAQKERRP